MSMANENSMSFLDHLEELRWRIIKSLIAVLVGGIITFFFVDKIISFLIAPTKRLSINMQLQVLRVQGMFLIKWGLAIVGGVILALPVLTYQLVQFVAPGLYSNEKRYLYPFVFSSYIFFLVGIVFAYTVIIPFSLRFFTSMGIGDIQNNFSINYYFSFITWLILGSGVIFELPVVVFILSSIGLLTPPFMRHYRRHAIVFIAILSAFITPPDPVSMLAMGIPLAALYEISIGVSWVVTRKKMQAAK